MENESDLLNYVASELYSLEALSSEEYLDFIKEYSGFSRTFLYQVVNNFHNNCKNCDRHEFRLSELDSFTEPKDSCPIIFLSSSPKYLDSLYGTSYVTLKDIVEISTISLSNISEYRSSKRSSNFQCIRPENLYTGNSDSLAFWQQDTTIGPLYNEGQILNYCLDKSGLHKEDFVFEYLTRCPKYSSSGESSYISPKHIKVCLRWLILKCKILSPKLIVTLGKESATVTQNTETPVMGKVIDNYTFSSPVLSIKTPGILLRNIDHPNIDSKVDDFIKELKLIGKYINA